MPLAANLSSGSRADTECTTESIAKPGFTNLQVGTLQSPLDSMAKTRSYSLQPTNSISSSHSMDSATSIVDEPVVWVELLPPNKHACVEIGVKEQRLTENTFVERSNISEWTFAHTKTMHNKFHNFVLYPSARGRSYTNPMDNCDIAQRESGQQPGTPLFHIAKVAPGSGLVTTLYEHCSHNGFFANRGHVHVAVAGLVMAYCADADATTAVDSQAGAYMKACEFELKTTASASTANSGSPTS